MGKFIIRFFLIVLFVDVCVLVVSLFDYSKQLLFYSIQSNLTRTQSVTHLFALSFAYSLIHLLTSFFFLIILHLLSSLPPPSIPSFLPSSFFTYLPSFFFTYLPSFISSSLLSALWMGGTMNRRTDCRSAD